MQQSPRKDQIATNQKTTTMNSSNRSKRMAQQAGRESLKFLGQLLLSVFAVLLLIYCGGILIADFNDLGKHSELGHLDRVTYFSTKESDEGCKLPYDWDEKKASTYYYELCDVGTCCCRLQGLYVLKMYGLMLLNASICIACFLVVCRFTCNCCFGLLTCRYCHRVRKKGRSIQVGSPVTFQDSYQIDDYP